MPYGLWVFRGLIREGDCEMTLKKIGDNMKREKTKKEFEAFCLVCCGGGKTLEIGSKKDCERSASSHSSAYKHNVTVLERSK